jgi:hypothetical protein
MSPLGCTVMSRIIFVIAAAFAATNAVDSGDRSLDGGAGVCCAPA